MINPAAPKTDDDPSDRASHESTRPLSVSAVVERAALLPALLPALLTALLASIAAPSLGCYRPSITNGGLRCAPVDLCPSGYACLADRCWAHGTGPEGGPPDADAGEDQNSQMPDVPAVECLPPNPKPQCTPRAGTNAVCDPTCQSGKCNWCNQKCTIAGDGNTVCASRGSAVTTQSCTIAHWGTSLQNDTCVAGDICLAPDVGAGYQFCFTLCHSSVDCPGGVDCAPRPVAPPVNGTPPPPADVCDPPYSKCDPASPTACCDPISGTGCAPDRFCYLVTPEPLTGTNDSRTVCEYATGGTMRDSCRSSRDCIATFGCSPMHRCQRVCNEMMNPCPNDGLCSHAGSGNQYGYCPL